MGRYAPASLHPSLADDYNRRGVTQLVARRFDLKTFPPIPCIVRGFACLVLAATAGCAQNAKTAGDAKPMIVTGRTMGTTYTVKIAGPIKDRRLAEVKAEIEKRLQQVNDQMSTWQQDSEISRFNRYRQTDWFPVSKDFVAVVQEANRISQRSDGAFDVTVGPLVNLWSFGPENRPKKIPTDEEIAQRKQHVGHDRLRFRTNDPALSKADPELTVDLSAIAKGYGVDVIAKYIESLKPTGYMVEIGGEVRCGGTKADGSPWRIGIQSPQSASKAADRIVELKDKALATSGDYRNYFEHNGKRYSHTIDPRTGRPVEHKLVSVSVIADTCTTADAWATTLMVLGPDAGYELAKKQGLAVLMIVRVGERFEVKATGGFSGER